MKRKISRKEKRRQQRIRRLTLTVLGVVFAASLFILYYSDFFSIETIVVSGNAKTTKEEIVIKSGIHFGDNIIKTDLKKAEEEVKKLPYVKTADITRESSKKVIIRITERTEEFSYYSGGLIYICDKDGRVLRSSEASTVFPVIKGYELEDIKIGENIFERDGLDDVIKIMNEAKENGELARYKEIRFQKNNEYGLLRENGVKIEFGQADNIKYKFNFIDNALKSLEKQGKSAGLIKLNINPPVVVPAKEGEQ